LTVNRAIRGYEIAHKRRSYGSRYRN
jgi:hypothetical protein